MWMREVFFLVFFFIIKAYLLPEGFFTLSVRLVWGGQRDVLVLLFEHSFCQVIVVEQRRSIVEGLKPKTGYESACCSYSEWRGQSAQGHCSTAREQRTAHPLGPSERPAARSPSERRKLASLNANCYNSPLPMHAWGVMRDGTCGARHVCKHTNTSVHVLSQSSHILFMVIQRRNTLPPHIPPDWYSLTAFSRLSALGMCSKSTKGWVKNSAKVIRASGFRSSSRSRRSLQSLETLAPGGSWCTKHDLIMLHSISRTIRGKRTAFSPFSHHYFLSKDDLNSSG